MRKILLIATIFLSSLGGICQSQISELSKSLIFSTKLDEWGQGRDEVSGVMPTSKVDVYNVLDRQGSGRRYLENINTGYASIADNARYDFGTGDFTLIASFTPANITDNGKYIISKEASGIGYGIYQQGADLYVRIDDNTHDASGKIGTSVLVAGTKITVCVAFNRAGNAVLYLNGSTSSSGTLAISTSEMTLDNTGAFVVGNIEAHNQGFTGQIHFVRAFNFAGTGTQISNYSRPEYPIEWVDRGATGAELVTNGSFTGSASGWTLAGDWSYGTNNMICGNTTSNLQQIISAININKKYILSVESAVAIGNAFIGYGGSGTSLLFINGKAQGLVTVGSIGPTTVFVQSHNTTVDNVSVIQAGCVLDLNAEGINRQDKDTVDPTKWWDATNGQTATVSGATVVIPPASNLGAMSFNGTTSKVVLSGVPTSALGATDRTISAWINLQTIPAVAAVIIDYGIWGAGTDYLFRVLSSGKLSVGNSEVNAASGSTTALNINIWYHVLTTYSGGVVKYYLNGVLDGTTTLGGTTNTTYGSMWIGIYSNSTYYFPGLISKGEIYKESLDADRIKLLYDLGH